MGADYIKDLIVDEKNNKITCKMADCKDRQRIFRNFEYTSKNNLFEEKYSELLWDIFSCSVHFYDQKHKLSTLIYAKELKNYYTDCAIIGKLNTYKKYKSKIEQILSDKNQNKNEEIIPSELELNYKLQCGFGKKYEEISKIFHRIENITENEILSIEQKQEMYKNILIKEFGESNLSKPIFIFCKKDNPNIIVSAYPILKKSNNPITGIYAGYYFDIKNIETNYQQRYDNTMMVSYMIDDEERTQIIMQEMEQRFIKDEQEHKYLECTEEENYESI